MLLALAAAVICFAPGHCWENLPRKSKPILALDITRHSVHFANYGRRSCCRAQFGYLVKSFYSYLIIINEKISVAFSPKTARHLTHKKDDMFGRQRNKQEGQQRHQYEVSNKYVFKCLLKVDSD